MKKIKLTEKILPNFYESWKAMGDPRYLHIVEAGGRGSSKSTTISERMIVNRMNSKTNGLCIRKYSKTLRTSCRNQLIWAIHHLEVQDYWKYSNAPNGDMTLEYIPLGTKIFFEGADGDKVKGWKTIPMPTVDIWFEELAEFKDDTHVTSIELSILREILPDGYSYKFYKSYNPPKRRGSWVNKKYETQFLPDNVYVHKSDYRDNIYLPQEFLDEAEHVKATNEMRYRWEYLGEPIGSGIVPFDNLEFREITDEEFNTFDNIRQGNDWGYSVDPNAFVQWHYDKTRKKIYAMNEIYQIKLSNEELARRIKKLGAERIKTIADSAEPKSIDELKSLGCRFKPAEKGKGSVEYGEKWLDNLEAIVIDPERTPNLAREFENIDYDVDKDGNPTTRLVDKDNHGIDATRYAFSEDMKGRKVYA